MNGWLSPNGKFFECGVSEHREKAKELFLSNNPEYSLERMNWIKIVPDFIFASIMNDFVNPQKLTQSQIDWLWDRINSKDVSCLFCKRVGDILRESQEM
jgi:hypothetical protein